MGHAVDSAFTIGESELSCGMMEMDITCDFADGAMTLIPQSCCDNDHISIQIKDDYQVDADNITIEKQFLYAFTFAFLSFSLTNHDSTFKFSTSHSPPLGTDRQSLYQTFLL